VADIINLRRARKAKTRDAKSAEADANRVKHGVAKSVRGLAKARVDKDKRDADARKLDKD
jgi:Domain of unknown function (DUF4169)